MIRDDLANFGMVVVHRYIENAISTLKPPAAGGGTLGTFANNQKEESKQRVDKRTF